MVKKVHENSFTKTYPPAVVAHLVCSILQFCWCIFVIARSHRGFMARAVNMMIAVVFFMAFGVGESLRRVVLMAGSIAATTGLRHHIQYCPSSASNFDDCRGVLRVGVKVNGADVRALRGWDLQWPVSTSATLDISPCWLANMDLGPPTCTISPPVWRPMPIWKKRLNTSHASHINLTVPSF